jgi:L-threonylcarbamoyladenylate synthase
MNRKTRKIETRVVRVSRIKPERGHIREAARLIRSGELVAFPTETVYGLGANGLKESAIKKVFWAKNRPPDNPLILHIGYKKDIERYGRNISPAAKKLARAFWPGPLTVIVRKRKKIPKIVSGGLDTVALRMPASKIALSLIRRARSPIAAPSANVSGKPSPTAASHVYHDMHGKVALILDGGKTEIGIESTIVDCSVDPPVLLRPGRINLRQLERIIGNVENNLYNNQTQHQQPKSPGLKYRHYAPDANLVLVEGHPKAMKETIDALIRQYRTQYRCIGILAFYPGHNYNIRKTETLVNLGLHADRASRKFFETLRFFDEQSCDVIIAESFPAQDHAISNRLRKAASEIIIARN